MHSSRTARSQQRTHTRAYSLISLIAMAIFRALARRLQLSTRTFKVYTRTGDEGTSMLFNAERRAKDDAVFQALGSTDELNACVGIARAHAEDCEAVAPLPGQQRVALHNPLAGLVEQLGAVQSRLFDVGSAVATPRSRSTDAQLRRAAFGDDGASSADELERWIDAMDAELPPLSNFILPGGGLVGASLHHARAVCRRAERDVVPLVREAECEAAVAVYLNRLSDYLFVAARFAARRIGEEDAVYQKARVRGG